MGEGNGLGKLLDIELEANIRFGAREMSLAELLEIGPGAVIPLDRQITDPVDLIIGDKVVARGEVVLVQGKFGLRVTEVLSEWGRQSSQWTRRPVRLAAQLAGPTFAEIGSAGPAGCSSSGAA